MKSIIPIFIMTAMFASVAQAQIDTLALSETETINLPDSITQIYAQDLTGDSLKELILCTASNIYVYNSAGDQLLWTSPALLNPRELQFDELNGDSFLDIGARSDTSVMLLDWHNMALIWQIHIDSLQYGCYTVGDADDDGASDFVIANKHGHNSQTGRDTVWIDIYYGPEYSANNGFIINMSNYWYSNNYEEWGCTQTPQLIKILRYGNIDSYRKAFAIFSAASYYEYSWQWSIDTRSVTGGIWLMDAETFQGFYIERIGISESAGTLELNGVYYPYSACSFRSIYTSDNYNFQRFVRKEIIKIDPFGIFDSTTIYFYDRTQPGRFWADWQGFASGEVNNSNPGPELCFGVVDTIIEYSIATNQRVWNQTTPADSQTIVGIFNSNILFQSSQVLSKSILPSQEYYFVDGVDHSLRAILPDDNTVVSLISDINNDGNDEILSISGNSLHVYSLLRANSIGSDVTLPGEFAIIGNYPNPFNARTTIKYYLPAESDIRLEIYDIAGRRIVSLQKYHCPAGTNQIVWDAKDRSSGIYFYTISAGGRSKTYRMVLLK